METKVTHGRPPMVRKLVLSLVLGIGVSIGTLLAVLFDSEGAVPKGVCSYVPVGEGILPIDPSGKGSYECAIHWLALCFYTLVPAGFVGAIIYAALGLIVPGRLWEKK